MTINVVFIKFLMFKFKLSFDEAFEVYKEYLKFRDSYSGHSTRGGKK